MSLPQPGTHELAGWEPKASSVPEGTRSLLATDFCQQGVPF